MNDAATAREHFAVLDGLRGLAILLVVTTHSVLTGYRPSFALGSLRIGIEPVVLAGGLGVELFFFLSGFVLFLPYARAMRGETPRPTLGHFIDRRFIKIVPSYYLALVVTLFFFYSDPDLQPRFGTELLRHLTFTHPFWQESLFFYSNVSVFWSIGIEVQFYVLFPFIAAAMRRRPVPTYLVLLALGEGFRIWLHTIGMHEFPYWISQLPAHIDLFGLGMLCAWGFLKFKHHFRQPRNQWLATAVAVSALAFGTWLLNDFARVTKTMSPNDHFAWQSDHRLVVGLTIAALTMGSLFGVRGWRASIANPLLVWLSTISYNLYLWHTAVLAQCIHTGFPCSRVPTPWLTDRNWGPDFFFSYLGVSLLIAGVITYGFERPLLRLGTRGALERYLVHPLSALLSGRGGPRPEATLKREL